MSLNLFLLVLCNVLFNTIAQIILKTGMTKIGTFDFNWSNLFPVANKIITSPWIIWGMVIYAGSVGLWLMVLSRTAVSTAYPMVSLGYITSTIAAYYLFGEAITLTKVLGIIAILIGVYLIAKS